MLFIRIFTLFPCVFIQEAKEIRKTKLAKTQDAERQLSTPTSSQYSTVLSDHIASSTPVMRSPSKMEAPPPLNFTGLFSRGDSLLAAVAPITPTGPLACGPLVSPCSSSLQDLSDESSNISQSSYLTEKDLKLQCKYVQAIPLN